MKKGGSAILGSLIGGVAGAAAVGKISQNMIQDRDKKATKFKTYYNMLNQWLCLKQDNKNLSTYFEKNNYKRIAVYGLGEMGCRLMDELKHTDIQIVYGIDKNVDNLFCDIKVCSIDEIDNNLESVDAVVVTAVFAFDEIMEDIEDKFDCPIISLEDVVYEI